MSGAPTCGLSLAESLLAHGSKSGSIAVEHGKVRSTNQGPVLPASDGLCRKLFHSIGTICML